MASVPALGTVWFISTFLAEAGILGAILFVAASAMVGMGVYPIWARVMTKRIRLWAGIPAGLAVLYMTPMAFFLGPLGFAFLAPLWVILIGWWSWRPEEESAMPALPDRS